MKLILTLLMAACVLAAADWDAVQRIPAGQKIEITTDDGTSNRATFASATADSLVLHDKTGERSLPRTQVRQVRIYDPSRRVRQGLLWTMVGAGAGAAGGLAVCPSCSNEGHGGKFVGPGVAIGAGVGALGFLSSPYRIIYKTKNRRQP